MRTRSYSLGELLLTVTLIGICLAAVVQLSWFGVLLVVIALLVVSAIIRTMDYLNHVPRTRMPLSFIEKTEKFVGSFFVVAFVAALTIVLSFIAFGVIGSLSFLVAGSEGLAFKISSVLSVVVGGAIYVELLKVFPPED